LWTSLPAACVTTLGIVTVRRFAGWDEHNPRCFMCFAAGVLVAAVIAATKA
jgi:hypothetical protein